MRKFTLLDVLGFFLSFLSFSVLFLEDLFYIWPKQDQSQQEILSERYFKSIIGLMKEECICHWKFIGFYLIGPKEISGFTIHEKTALNTVF